MKEIPKYLTNIISDHCLDEYNKVDITYSYPDIDKTKPPKLFPESSTTGWNKIGTGNFLYPLPSFSRKGADSINSPLGIPDIERILKRKSDSLDHVVKIKKILNFISFFNKRSEKYKMVLAGGCLRDFLNKVEPNDYDIFVISKSSELIDFKSLKTKEGGEKIQAEILDEIRIAEDLFNEKHPLPEISGFKNPLKFFKSQSLQSSEAYQGHPCKLLNSLFVHRFSILESDKVTFSHSLNDDPSKIQIIFRPNISNEDELVYEFDIAACQFYAINNSGHDNTVLFSIKHSCNTNMSHVKCDGKVISDEEIYILEPSKSFYLSEYYSDLLDSNKLDIQSLQLVLKRLIKIQAETLAKTNGKINPVEIKIDDIIKISAKMREIQRANTIPK